jgi:hypothetical protein
MSGRTSRHSGKPAPYQGEWDTSALRGSVWNQPLRLTPPASYCDLHFLRSLSEITVRHCSLSIACLI